MNFKKSKLFVLFTLTAVLGLGGTNALSQQPEVVKSKSDKAADASDAEKRRQSFEIVWQTVNKNFYDANFNGVNWKAVHDRYAPLIARTTNDQDLYSVLQQMINELHQSHFFIVPPQAIPKLSGNDESEDDVQNDNEEGGSQKTTASTALDRIRRRLAERLSTGIGIDLRVIDGAAVITRVEAGSPAARADLRPGFVIKNVNGKPLSQTIAEIEANPIFHQIIRPEVPMILVAQYINGNLRDPVSLTYVDGRNLPHTVRITREKLKGEMSPAIGNLPSIFGEFEARRLPGRVGYIRFNAFVPALMTKVCAALREMHDEQAIVIDLRGNQGGLLGMIGGLSGLLELYPVTLGSMKMRSGYNSVFAFPQREPYTGEVAILIDGSTLSAAEIFTAGMQETLRAVVVGDVSAGNTLPSGIIKLPTGALFQYAFGNYQTPSGMFLEGRGVIPDMIVKLNRRSLLRGGDPQLTAAISKLRETIRLKRRGELIADVSAAEPFTKKTGPTRVEISEPPAPPPPKAPKENKTGSIEQPKPPANPDVPSVEQIINRYIESLGGEAALNKITSRVSTGTIELGSMGLKGSVEVYEQAPNRSSVMMNLKGFGLIQQTFNGSARWLHDPVQGYITLPREIPGSGDDFHSELRLKRMVASLRFEQKEKVGQRDCFVLDRIAGATVVERFYFDVENGLLLRRNNSFYEDYRAVEGVKVAFAVRQEGPFGDVFFRLTQVKNNVPIDEAKFVERDDCFTKPEQYWHPAK